MTAYLISGFGAALAALAMLLLGAYAHEAIEGRWRRLRARSAAVTVYLHASLLPAQGSHSAAVMASDLPRRKPLVNRQPWQTAEMPAIRVPAAQLALDPGDGLDEPALARPYVPTDEETRELYYGGSPVADVLAAETAPPFPYDPGYDNCAGTATCGSDRVFYRWYGTDHTACPRCYTNVFGGEPDPSSVHNVADVLEAERLAAGLMT